MKLLLKVHHSDHDDHSEYAFLDLTPEYARTLLQSQAAFQSVRGSDSNLYRITYWDATPDWFGGPCYLRDSHHSGQPYPESWHVEDFGDPAEAFLRQHLTEEAFNRLNQGYGPHPLPEAFYLPKSLIDCTECDILDVVADGILYKSYPKNGDNQQETDSISWDLVRQAASLAADGNPPPALDH